MKELFDRFGQIKIVPVVTLNNPEHALPVAEALQEGGIPCMEITFRTASAADAIRKLQGEKDLLLGAGSVLKIEQAKTAMDGGAQFIVSPGFNPKVVEYCVDNKIPVIPGTSNPTDFDMALDFGLEVVKFFPSEALGGISTLKAMSAPYPMLKFVPTGGINPGNLLSYLAFPRVLACGGSWMVKSDWINSQDFGQIKNASAEAIRLIKEAK